MGKPIQTCISSRKSLQWATLVHESIVTSSVTAKVLELLPALMSPLRGEVMQMNIQNTCSGDVSWSFVNRSAIETYRWYRRWGYRQKPPLR